jgi:hypothetical protein
VGLDESSVFLTALMAAMTGCNFLMSRSCLVPINHATTWSTNLATSMDGSPSPDGH